MNPKKLGKRLLCRLLERQVKQLRRRNSFVIIAVAGSVGKTSTKLAIAKTLGASRPVRFQDGNYNDRLTVPLIFFGEDEPGIYNLAAWFAIWRRNRRQVKQPFPYEVVVVEIGTDGPGQLRDFAYLEPDIVVVTAIADEHMEYFGTLDAVAREELTPLQFSKQALLNIDDIPARYLPSVAFRSYGFAAAADFRVIAPATHGLQGQKLDFRLSENRQLTTTVAALGQQGAKIALAAAAVADMLGLSSAEIKQGLAAVTPVSGRMQILAGKEGSFIIDDTYNASPIATRAALDVLYGTAAKQRIAILGSMNELGADSPKLHQEVGAYCDPAKLQLVVTIGQEARQYLAPAAAKQGCQVQSFDSPYQAGQYVLEHLQHEAVILAKGSQNGVFAEEAVKQLLVSNHQVRKLVRQSDYWLARKSQQFPQG